MFVAFISISTQPCATVIPASSQIRMISSEPAPCILHIAYCISSQNNEHTYGFEHHTNTTCMQTGLAETTSDTSDSSLHGWLPSKLRGHSVLWLLASEATQRESWDGSGTHYTHGTHARTGWTKTFEMPSSAAARICSAPTAGLMMRSMTSGMAGSALRLRFSVSVSTVFVEGLTQ